MRVVMNACEEVHVLDHGETIAHGTPAEVRNDAHVIDSYLGSKTRESSPIPLENKFDLRSRPLLEMKDVARALRNIEALNGISLHVNRGEIVALVGANGARQNDDAESDRATSSARCRIARVRK